MGTEDDASRAENREFCTDGQKRDAKAEQGAGVQKGTHLVQNSVNLGYSVKRCVRGKANGKGRKY